MKKTLKTLSLLLGFAVCIAGSMTLASCGDDDDNSVTIPNSSDNISTSDLVGTWNIAGQDDQSTWVFTNDKLTITEWGTQQFDGPYTVNGDKITYRTKYWKYNPQTQQQEEVEGDITVKIGLICDKAVLVLKSEVKNEQGTDYEFSYFMFKEGKNITATANDIQGTWDWYMHGDQTYVRTRLTISGNKFDMIITPWGQRYTGTFTYANGYITLNTEHGYTSREEGTGDGFGEGDIDPETLEGTWKNLNSWNIWEKMPFVANGNEAYGIVANLSALFYKK